MRRITYRVRLGGLEVSTADHPTVLLPWNELHGATERVRLSDALRTIHPHLPAALSIPCCAQGTVHRLRVRACAHGLADGTYDRYWLTILPPPATLGLRILRSVGGVTAVCVFAYMFAGGAFLAVMSVRAVYKSFAESEILAPYLPASTTWLLYLTPALGGVGLVILLICYGFLVSALIREYGDGRAVPRVLAFRTDRFGVTATLADGSTVQRPWSDLNRINQGSIPSLVFDGVLRWRLRPVGNMRDWHLLCSAVARSRPALDTRRNKHGISGRFAVMACLVVAGGLTLIGKVYQTSSMIGGHANGVAPLWKVITLLLTLFAILATVLGLAAHAQRHGRGSRHKWHRCWTRSRG